MGTLEAGTYRTNHFEPQLLLTLPDGWGQFFADEADEVYMGSPEAELAIARPPELRDPETSARVPTPEDLLAWLVDHPVLGASEPTPVTISGIESNWVEFNATRDVRVFAFPGGDFRIGAGARQRMYVVPLNGPDLAVTIGARESGTLAQALAAAVPIMESLQIVP
jgi:hypothetical protein